MQTESLLKSEEPLVLSGVQGNMIFPVSAKRMHRLFGPCEGAARRDVSVAADAGRSPGVESDCAAWVLRRKAKKERESRRGKDGDVKKAKIKVREMVGPIIASAEALAFANPSFTCNNEYHLASNCASRGELCEGVCAAYTCFE